MAVSEKQLLANQQNALSSTGPKTVTGKSISSKNALTHGLRAQQIVVEGESQEEFDDFRDLLIGHLIPDGPLEILLVDRIAASSWRLRRTGSIEAQIFDEMRNSLAAARTPNPKDFFVETNRNDDIGFHSRSRFKTFQEAKAAWDATEDGIAYAEGSKADDGSGSDSFTKFLKDSRVPDPESLDSRPFNMVDAISNLKKKHEDRPDLFGKLSELQDTYKSIAKHKSLHIPSLKQYLLDVRELIHTSPDLADKYASDLDDAVREISHLEMTINRQLRPNLGQAISCDLKGPDILSKFTRYESQIQCSLFKAMHELQRLQAIRQGRQTTAPVTIDVDITGEYPP